jgi:hypothetical protein
MIAAATIPVVHEPSARTGAAYAKPVDPSFADGARAPRQWRPIPGELVSLWDMLEFDAGDFFTQTDRLARIWSALGALPKQLAQGGASDDLRLTDDPNCEEWVKKIVSYVRGTHNDLLSDLVEPCRTLGLDSAVAQIERILGTMTHPSGCTIAELTGMVNDLRQRIYDQLKQRFFLFVPIEKAKYYSDKELFGVEVEDKLPEAIYDIAEAGKCLALGRSTATVCHLMRVVEVGVVALAKKLSATIKTDQPWGAILREVDDAVKALKASGTDVLGYMSVSASLHAVKEAWRNPAMHSKSKYTEEEAEEIFNASRTFMRKLGQII